ncbi:glycosyl hydrolase family 43 [Jejuia pallidilutea]|uniref:Glycosyl hydrolase family 43 n=1 Tax=Jejuia pallidilutea TaxID=504487 RepID=A0A362X020_9FLAO|nr:family 43 glycosylhydrolase [Jejuia pallidilutea]PQV48836.1 glycosyl hydrolase family 43 [Jejuia pallidilutea]
MNQENNKPVKNWLQKQLFLHFLIIFTIQLVVAQNITVNNELPRLDKEGNIVDAHDGRLIQFKDTFYWYGTSYGNTNGFTTKNHYVCYSSKDLKVWKKEGRLLPNQPEGVYYRPHVVYNKKNKNYVLWYNWYPKLWNGQFGVAISKSPTGPFKIVNSNVKMYRSDVGLGDFGLFVDDDETCYLSYNTIQNHQVSVEKLNEDYTASTMKNGGIIAEHMEAGTQFKKDGKYYLLTDYTCCFCNYGSGARVYISNNPLSGYELTTNINRYPGRPSYLLNNNNTTGTIYETLSSKEGVFDAVVVQFSENKTLSKIQIHQFTGNRPENCGNVDNPRVHPKIVEPTFNLYRWNYNQWETLDINETTIEKSALKQKTTLSFSTTNGTRFKIVPIKDNYTFNEFYINEINLFNGAIEIPNSAANFYITGQDIPQKQIIPAQQSYVTKIQTVKGDEYFWVGDLWGSASDNVKGHDYQYWSSPLQFNKDGTIKPLTWVGSWKL